MAHANIHAARGVALPEFSLKESLAAAGIELFPSQNGLLYPLHAIAIVGSIFSGMKPVLKPCIELIQAHHFLES